MLKDRCSGKDDRPQPVVKYVTTMMERFNKIRKLANEKEKKLKSVYKKQYNKKAGDNKFNVGDMVLLRIPQRTRIWCRIVWFLSHYPY